MLKLLKSGLYTTVQDAGRFGYRHKGVPVAGVMDSFAAQKVNMLLENQPEAAVLEITMTGPTLEFEEDTYIALGGADMSVGLNNIPIHNYTVYKIKSGDTLSYLKLNYGFRGYLAIKDGFKSEVVLGSRSLFKPVTSVNRLKDNDQLLYTVYKSFQPKIQKLKVDSFLDDEVLEVDKGPEFDLLNDKHLEGLFNKEFTVAPENNRMAYQLNESIPGHEISILTSATLPGTVQLTPSGKLIILMKDGQTTGGYPRILQLSEKAINILAQKKAGDIISLKLPKKSSRI
ncbi:biotin-dependent carboxyltransferase family protein [Flavobacteriaceae bacterium F89]|uniref:Biotin-dependent carboxyltransferase family protein n=1 Tax=Cerina litoralis TaxID=2874477 RepID=A0AAE3JQE8_9FLAO|nr:biotin-dependent carboxyltransferase family protein [Cerina litoralis]MCG2461789.1 biotin-dependent carboxyltransferase family protein [Cerina litoralis]